ncbi:MAG: hypothetical protein ACR2OY_05755, partial [Boseongicola sp.]
DYLFGNTGRNSLVPGIGDAVFFALSGGDSGIAKSVALAGALAFTTNWAGFLIGAITSASITATSKANSHISCW